MASAAPNIAEYSVTELSGALKRSVEDQFGHVRVRGEISQFKRAASGHCYFRLKDEKAVIDGIVWRGVAGRLSMQPEDGLEVIATGKVTTYPARSSYQIVIEDMAPAGKGALMALLEERRKTLQAEGLFAQERKKRLPFLPETIGVITSPTGSVIRDILHRLSDRFPRHVLVWPVAVQGEAAAGQVAAAIQGFQSLPLDIPRPDVLIVARGGGSLEDLWAFNEEVVVRAIAECNLPIISAVGHETDTTLADYAADQRAPTPTAAAEMAVPVRADLAYSVDTYAARSVRAMARRLDQSAERLRGLARGLPKPQEVLAQKEQRLDDVFGRLEGAGRARLASAQSRFETVNARLSPRLMSVGLERQNAILREAGGRLTRALPAIVRTSAQRVSSVAARLRLEPIGRQLERSTHMLTQLAARGQIAVNGAMKDRTAGLKAQTRMLESLSFHGTLARGYALVRADDGRLVRSKGDIAAGDALTVELQDGQFDAVAGRSGDGSASKRSKPVKAKKPAAPGQGSLF